MTMYLKNGNTFSQMARLAGVNETTIARRINKIIRRLTEGEYITCLRHRQLFSRKEMKIARDYFLSGKPMKIIAEKQCSSYYRVRETIKKIQRLVELAENSKTRGRQITAKTAAANR